MSQPRQVPAVAHLSVQYVGFRDVEDRREYVLRARIGQDSRDYTVSIALAAFASGRARLSDGPDICFQKLMREIPDGDGRDTAVEVSNEDLVRYRDAHAAAPRKRRAVPLPGTGERQ